MHLYRDTYNINNIVFPVARVIGMKTNISKP